MEELKRYNITLDDGTVIRNLTLNGNNFISNGVLTKEMFENNLSTVEISDGTNSTVYHNMELVQIWNKGSEYWFILREMTEDELEKLDLQANVDYLNMITEFEL